MNILAKPIYPTQNALFCALPLGAVFEIPRGDGTRYIKATKTGNIVDFAGNRNKIGVYTLVAIIGELP